MLPFLPLCKPVSMEANGDRKRALITTLGYTVRGQDEALRDAGVVVTAQVG